MTARTGGCPWEDMPVLPYRSSGMFCPRCTYLTWSKTSVFPPGDCPRCIAPTTALEHVVITVTAPARATHPESKD
jgi:hypothetical protein